MIEIRKMETDRIPPTPAGDHSARVNVDQRPHDQPDRDAAKREHADDEETSAADTPDSVQTYDPEGHLDEPGPGHHIDFTA